MLSAIAHCGRAHINQVSLFGDNPLKLRLPDAVAWGDLSLDNELTSVGFFLSVTRSTICDRCHAKRISPLTRDHWTRSSFSI
jgi:hypothetical protein